MSKKTIAISLILIILAVGGFFVLRGKQQRVNNQVVTTQIKDQSQQNSSQDISQSIWYEVSELGIKFPVNEKNKSDLIYEYKSSSGNSSGQASFSLKSIENNGKYCKKENGPLGIIVKKIGQYKQDDSVNGCLGGGIFSKQFDNFFVCYYGPQADDGCFGDITKTKGLDVKDYIGLDSIEKI